MYLSVCGVFWERLGVFGEYSAIFGVFFGCFKYVLDVSRSVVGVLNVF